jgi:hypothetical protein
VYFIFLWYVCTKKRVTLETRTERHVGLRVRCLFLPSDFSRTEKCQQVLVKLPSTVPMNFYTSGDNLILLISQRPVQPFSSFCIWTDEQADRAKQQKYLCNFSLRTHQQATYVTRMSRPSWEMVSRSAGQDIPHLLQNLKLHDCVQNSSPLEPILSQVNPIHTLLPSIMILFSLRPLAWGKQNLLQSDEPIS